MLLLVEDVGAITLFTAAEASAGVFPISTGFEATAERLVGISGITTPGLFSDALLLPFSNSFGRIAELVVGT